MLSGKEYRSARAEAFARADNRCEYTIHRDSGAGEWMGDLAIEIYRCTATGTDAHHLRYPKSRPVEASDLLIVCKYHHELLESQKLHKRKMIA